MTGLVPTWGEGWGERGLGLSADPSCVDDLAGLPTFYAFDVGGGDLFGGHSRGRVRTHLGESLRDPGRADGVDADAARHLERGGAPKSLDGRVDRTDGCASRNRLVGEHAAREREGSAVAHVRKTQTHEVDLAHPLPSFAELEVRVRQRLERRKLRQSRRADEGVEGSKGGIELHNRGPGRDVHAMVAVRVRDPHDIVAPLERPDDPLTDGSRRAHDDNSHGRPSGRDPLRKAGWGGPDAIYASSPEADSLGFERAKSGLPD